jgi:tetratricopeptide (TPR) repeat protein
MNRIIIIIALFLLSCLQGIGADFKVLWKKGTDLYLQKQYDSAAIYFEKVAALKPENAEIYYNLGNAYYRLNRIAQAVLNYERALRIDPDYTDAADNLLITQARISHQIHHNEDIFFVSWWKDLTDHTKATSWAIASLVFFVLIIVSVWVRRYRKEGDRLPVQLPYILGFVCVVFLVFGFAAASKTESSPGAIVMENDAALMNSEQKGKPLALIPEGTKVTVGEGRGMWVEVILPDGRTGWMQRAQLIGI